MEVGGHMYMILTPTQATWKDFSMWPGYEAPAQLWYNYKFSTAIISSSKWVIKPSYNRRKKKRMNKQTDKQTNKQTNKKQVSSVHDFYCAMKIANVYIFIQVNE